MHGALDVPRPRPADGLGQGAEMNHLDLAAAGLGALLTHRDKKLLDRHSVDARIEKLLELGVAVQRFAELDDLARRFVFEQVGDDVRGE